MSDVWYSVGFDIMRREWLDDEMRDAFLDAVNYCEAFDGADDLIPHHMALLFIPPTFKDGMTIYHSPRLCFDINDVRTICLNCGNSPDCCTCEDEIQWGG